MLPLPLLPRQQEKGWERGGAGSVGGTGVLSHSPGWVGPDLVAVLSLLQVMTRDGKVVDMGRVGFRSGVVGK